MQQFTTQSFKIGDLVENLGHKAKVVEIHDNGYYLILRKAGGRMKWLADPNKCKLLTEDMQAGW